MKADTDKIAVIFRTFRNGGDVIAFFPFIPATRNGWTCESYQHIGQHGAACPHLARQQYTRPSTPDEIKPLALELTSIGYKLKPMKRFPRNAYQVRKANV